MSEAPEYVFCKDGHDSWGAYGHWYEDGTGGGEKYIRADRIQALEQENKRLREALEGAMLCATELSKPEEYLCCDGASSECCGCMGATTHQQALHYLEEDTRAALEEGKQ